MKQKKIIKNETELKPRMKKDQRQESKCKIQGKEQNIVSNKKI